MNALVCETCNRKLVDRYFDKCMYCGRPLPEHQKLSKEESELIKAQRAQRAQEYRLEHEAYMAKHKALMRGDNGPVMGEWGHWEGGDDSGGDSGGDGGGD